jgi:hypothetical protein
MVTTERPVLRSDEIFFPPAVRILAKVLSYIFHPVFIPMYVCCFLVYEADLFPNRDSWHKMLVIIQFFVSYTFLPLAAILLAKALGFIGSIHLKTQKDRILPYIITEIFYFWAWYVTRNLGYPTQFVLFTLGTFLATSLGLILNSYLKVSMHAISMGVLATFILYCSFLTPMNYGFYIGISLLIAGVVCTARLVNDDHHPAEIYFGFFTGVVAVVVAGMFV